MLPPPPAAARHGRGPAERVVPPALVTQLSWKDAATRKPRTFASRGRLSGSCYLTGRDKQEEEAAFEPSCAGLF